MQNCFSSLLQAVCRYDGPGEATCICNSGWSGDGTSCSPIDPCALPSRGGCDTNANCLFTAPGEVCVYTFTNVHACFIGFILVYACRIHAVAILGIAEMEHLALPLTLVLLIVVAATHR